MPLKKYASVSIELRELRKAIAGYLKASDLSYGEFEILYLLKEKQLIQPSHIAVELKHDSGAISRILNKLNKKNLITYIHNDYDRRRVFVRITDNGVHLISSLLNDVVS